MCVCLCSRRPWHACGGHKTTRRNQFSPSTDDPETTLTCQAWLRALFPCWVWCFEWAVSHILGHLSIWSPVGWCCWGRLRRCGPAGGSAPFGEGLAFPTIPTLILPWFAFYFWQPVLRQGELTAGSKGTSFGCNIKFPHAPTLFKLCILFFFLPHLLLFHGRSA